MHIDMTHNDYKSLHEIRSRWQKEQQLIREKYQIPYNMTYTFKSCPTKPVSITLQDKSSFKYEKNIITQISRLDEHHSNIPPMHCSKCHLNLTECTCPDGLGQWWINLQKRTRFTDKISKTSSRNSINFDSSITDLSSITRTNTQKATSKPTKHQYVLLDWNNRLSLLNFIQTIKPTKKLSNMTIEQLRELITNNNHIHLFNSIIDLILCIKKEQTESFLCHIYIDPSYIPLSQSQLIADNINLNQAIYSIQKIANLLGVKISQSINEFLPETKQRNLILNQQSLFIASKIPYNTFYRTSI